MIHDQEGDKDLSRHRIVELDNGNSIHLERRDPYGFIHCWLASGTFPEKSPLNGVFTSWDRAFTAVDGYITERNNVVSDLRAVHIQAVKETNEEVSIPQEMPVRPVLKTKPVKDVKPHNPTLNYADLDKEIEGTVEPTTEAIKITKKAN